VSQGVSPEFKPYLFKKKKKERKKEKKRKRRDDMSDRDLVVLINNLDSLHGKTYTLLKAYQTNLFSF
jgi:hypothetical protein